ncbi:CCDC174 family protein [Wolbachia endosymbiont of Oedothorax gibbosus]|uniref:CCDC174 family protein n=1 Tax=Wolbachia endosymbiont of Oedothorax gibbosus TaxID=931100 RepID=UPI002024D672|nr:CCDC174 family protein [Wolbachia endosymbiont of Oedothorax gibbosus]
MFKAKVNDIPDQLPNDTALKRSVTREPISIFSQIKNAKDEEKKELNQLLEILRKKLPEGFKIGAAVGEGDCFFDSVAQGLNELKDKGLITSSKGFSVKSLRESCKQYAQKGSWLGNALKREGEKLCEYIQHIEFTSEDIESASSDSGIKTLKLENAIWGRPEIEGKIICEKYGAKIRIIELRDEEIDGLHVTKGKVGKGNTIYIANYRNHFVPLLSNIEKDIKRSIKVSREEAYGNVVGSNSNNISRSYISTPLQDIENSSHEQSDHSRSTGKENRKTGRKRGRSVTDKDDRVSKKLRIDVNIIKDSETPSDLQDEPRQNELHNARQTKQYIPYHLVGLMYQLDLSVLCSLRKFTYEHKYPSLSLAFGDSEIGKFNNIVLCNKKKSIHIQIENVDKYYIDNDIGYARLFTKEKEKRSFFINDYFDSFVKHLISKSNSLSNNIKYLVIHTNSGLDLTEEEKLKQGRSRSFYPFKFDGINMEECGILKDFLFTNDNTKGSGFYRFSQDKITREELFKRLEFSSAAQKVIEERKFSQEKVKEKFLDKLVFAVNQPNREELNSIVKSEIKDSKVQDNYIALQERILCDLTVPEKLGPGIIYEFNLLISFLHDMFLHKSMFFINSKTPVAD